MTRWKKDAKEFTVKLYTSKNRDAPPSLMCRVPRPLVAMLGDPKWLRFCVANDQVSVAGVQDE